VLEDPAPEITIQDSTLRDGNHAVRHQLGAQEVEAYCREAELAGVPILEVGHGNGLGASSFQVGIARISDDEMLRVARKNLLKTKLAVHIMPGFATIERDLKPALDLGVDVVRVGTHCTEADIAERHIQFVAKKGIEVVGSLMMSHMADKFQLLEEASKFQSYGASGVSLYDSAGSYLPAEVREKVSFLSANLKIKVGFHAHNNLGMAIANSVVAVESGARIIDACIKGFGAGAGNAQLEVLVAVFGKLGIKTGIDLYKILDCADLAELLIVKETPIIRPTSIVSGLAGVFSGFSKHVERTSKQYNVDPRDVFFELGRRKAVGGQEDLIIEAAQMLRRKESNC
jgi:4-hydroxy 2-oxovalerate aldolase